jgi:hypothetical protein
MPTRILILAVTALLLGSPSLALGAEKGSVSAVPFPVASVHFEQNATDGDAEVVFQVKGGKEGVVKLTVVSPDGRTVIDFTAPHASTLGIRQFHFETPEPRDINTLQSAYPEGTYTFSAATASGDKFRGQAALNHTLPPTASFLWPKPGARDVSVTNVKIAWNPVMNLSAYIITIKAMKVGGSLEATLPTSAAVFSMPEGFLRPGTEYKLAIGTVSAEGNISFAETTFTTGP